MVPAHLPTFGARDAEPGTTALIAQAFRRALRSQFHSRMLAALALPFFVALVGAVLLMALFWTPLTLWLNHEAGALSGQAAFDHGVLALGVLSLKVWATPIVAAALLLPMAGLLGLMVAAVFIMPIVLRHLEHRDYRGLRRAGRHTLLLGTGNALWVALLFVLGWLFTMPLWLIPPLAVVLPLFWWAFAVNRMLRVDAMIEHASPIERALLWRRHRGALWLIAGALALIHLIPLSWLIMPVFSSLVYAHFCLDAIARLRASQVIDV